jgi:hypothetical protein
MWMRTFENVILCNSCFLFPDYLNVVLSCDSVTITRRVLYL